MHMENKHTKNKIDLYNTFKFTKYLYIAYTHSCEHGHISLNILSKENHFEDTYSREWTDLLFKTKVENEIKSY